MVSFYEKDGFLYTHQLGHPDHVFEIVDFVPLGYTIWNIGKNMPEGYLPLCRLKAIQEFDGGRSIEPETLKAIRIPEAQLILSAAHYGDTLDSMEKFVKRYENDGKMTWCVDRVKEALPYVRRLKWR